MKKEFIYKYRIRYADTDKMGVAYHGRYFEWFEAARTELMRANGMSYDSLEDQGISLPVIEAQCRYVQSVQYDEIVQIKTWIDDVTRSRLLIRYELFTKESGRPKAHGFTMHCYMNKQGRAVRAPHDLVEFFNKFLSKKK